MKKTICLGIILCLLLFSGLSPVIRASGTAATVNASVNNETKLVTISGTVSAGSGKAVSVIVVNPSGNVDYFDQTVSGTGGSYQFQYVLDEQAGGTYAVSIGGTGISTPVTGAFVYTANSVPPAPIVTVTANAAVDNVTKEVTITGTISSGSGKQVSAVVVNPAGNVDFINQATSGAGGSYLFRYTLDETASGTYTVTVGGTGIDMPVSVTFTYTAFIPVSSISITPGSLTLDTETNTTAALTAGVSPSNATNKNVTWRSSDTSVVMVDASGKVTVSGAGSAVITATTEDSHKEASVQVTVRDTTLPSAPVNLRAGTKTDSSISMLWGASNDNVGVNSYTVYRNGSIAGVVSGSVLAFNATGLSSGVEYSFYVIAKDNSGNASPASNILTASTISSSVPPADSGDDADNGEDRQFVNEESLKQGGAGKVSVDVADGKHEVLLPAKAAEIIGDKKLEIKRGDISITIDPNVLQALSELAGTEASEDDQIAFRIKQASESEEESLANTSEGSGGSTAVVKSAGKIYHIDLVLVKKDGKESRLGTFGKPVEVALSYQEGADEALLGVYYFNEQTKEWEYVGGKVDKANNKVIAELSHFSTYAVLEYDKTFADVSAAHWAHQAVKVLSAKHVVTGISETEFAPRKEVTRAEYAALLTRSLGLKAKGEAPFLDIDASAWYAGEIAAAYEAKLITGRTETRFAPDDEITREEMAAMIVRAFELAAGQDEEGNSASFIDQEEVAEWAVEYVNEAVRNGLMKGIGGNSFAPAANSSRAEAAQTVYNLLIYAQE